MTVAEWKTYIGQLAGQALRSKTIAANSQAFVTAMREEGKAMSEVTAIVTAFMRQLAATGQAIPGGGVYDLPGMADIDLIAMRGPTIDPARVAWMIANPPQDENLEDVWEDEYLD